MSPEISESFDDSANKLICFLFLPFLLLPQALVLDFLGVLVQPSVYLLF